MAKGKAKGKAKPRQKKIRELTLDEYYELERLKDELDSARQELFGFITGIAGDDYFSLNKKWKPEWLVEADEAEGHAQNAVNSLENIEEPEEED